MAQGVGPGTTNKQKADRLNESTCKLLKQVSLIYVHCHKKGFKGILCQSKSQNRICNMKQSYTQSSSNYELIITGLLYKVTLY
jgi:hypothetical protein